MASLFGRCKAAIERLVFAGLKPDAPMAPKKSKIESLIESAEGLAARGLKSEDKPLPGPMSWAKKIGIVVGLLAIGGGIYVLVTVLQRPADQAEKTGPPPKPVEIIPKDFHVDKNKELEVVEIEFNKNKQPKEIVGTLRNLTDRSIKNCLVSFSVTTRSGSQLGGVMTTVTGLAPHGSSRFRITVPYADAGIVIVRDLQPE
jgi:hypothetical protein